MRLGRSEEPWAGVGAIEDAVGDGVVSGLRQVHAVPVGVRRRVRAHAGASHAAARLRVEVVWPAAAAARTQRTLSEPCIQKAVSEQKKCEFRNIQNKSVSWGELNLLVQNCAEFLEEELCITGRAS